jgi:hypothetical protein
MSRMQFVSRAMAISFWRKHPASKDKPPDWEPQPRIGARRWPKENKGSNHSRLGPAIRRNRTRHACAVGPKRKQLPPLLRQPLPRRHTAMGMHPDLSANRLPLLRSVSDRVAGPSPSGGHHHRLQVVIAVKALSDRAAIPRFVVDLPAVHRASAMKSSSAFFASGPGCH